MRRRIVYNGRQLHDVTTAAVDALQAANSPPKLFVRGGTPTRIRTDEDSKPIIEPITKDILRNRLSVVADWFRANKDGDRTSTSPPLEVATNVLADEAWPFPGLVGIVEVPILRPDGSFATDHGYDEATKLFHWRVAEYPPIPEQPTAEELAAAVAIVLDVLADFPFDTIADRANAIALLLTGIVRPAVEGQVPMALLDAPEPGTGKSLLARLTTLISTGRPGAMQSMPNNDEELEKRITALLLGGTTTVIFDNVDGTIKSGILAGALTADVWQGRLLGQTKTIEVPSRVTWMATGNNINVGGDLARRCYRIRLDARQAQPWRRTDFRHRDLDGYVRKHRTEIVVALCTMARSWWVSGRDVDYSLPALGGYTPWVSVVGGILKHCGIDGFLGNLDAFHADADREALGWEAFLATWHDHWGDEILTVGQFVRRLGDQQGMLGSLAVAESLPDDLSPVWGTAKFSTRLGRALANRAGRHYGEDGLHVVKHGLDRNKVIRYSVTVHRAGIGAGDTSDPRADATPLTSNDAKSAGDAGADLLNLKCEFSPVDNTHSHIELGDGTPADPRTPATTPNWDEEMF